MTLDLKALGWRELYRPGYIGAIGPLWAIGTGSAIRIGLQTDVRHADASGQVHGGVLLALADQALGVRLLEDNAGGPQATIEMEAQFVGACAVGDFIEGRAELVRRADGLAFLRGQIDVGGRPVVTMQGVCVIRDEAASARPAVPARP